MRYLLSPMSSVFASEHVRVRHVLQAGLSVTCAVFLGGWPLKNT